MEKYKNNNNNNKCKILAPTQNEKFNFAVGSYFILNI